MLLRTFDRVQGVDDDTVDGVDALVKALSGSFDAIIAADDLPGISGEGQICAACSVEDPWTREVPLILTSTAPPTPSILTVVTWSSRHRSTPKSSSSPCNRPSGPSSGHSRRAPAVHRRCRRRRRAPRPGHRRSRVWLREKGAALVSGASGPRSHRRGGPSHPCRTSRKSFLRAAIGDVPPDERDWATAAAVAASAMMGAHIVRVHAVREMVQVVKVADAILAAQSSPAP